MSGVDPNRAGVLVVGSGGGSITASQISDSTATGRSVLTGDAAAGRTALSAAAAVTATAAGQVSVSTGASTTYTARGRRPPTGVGTPELWYRCTETSGTTLANSGSTASADLTVQAAGVLCQRRAGALFPYGLECTGSATSEARGAAGIAVGSGSALTVWAWAVVDVKDGAIICRDYNAPGSGWSAPYVCAMISTTVTDGNWVVSINVGGTYRDIVISAAAGRYQIGVCHLFGLTWDGTTLTAWLDGRSVGTSTPGAGSISWNTGAGGRWHLGSNDAAELFDGVIYDAGAIASVWDASTWADAYARGIGVYGAT